MAMESATIMGLANVNLSFTENIAKVNLENLGISIQNKNFSFFVAGCYDFFTCSNHGSCSEVGTCQCVDGFYGDNCSSKLYNLLIAFSFRSLNFAGGFADQNLPIVFTPNFVKLWQLKKYL